MPFNTYLKNLRAEKMLTQEELASCLNVTVGAIRKIEAGDIKNPSSSLLINLSMFTKENTLKVLTDINYGDQGYENNLFNTYLTQLGLLGWKDVFNMPNFTSFICKQHLITQKRNPSHYTLLALIKAPKNYSSFDEKERDHYLSKQLNTYKKEIDGITDYPIKEIIFLYDDTGIIKDTELISLDLSHYLLNEPIGLKTKHVSFSLKTFTTTLEKYTN